MTILASHPRKVYLVGPLPPPVVGLSVINAALRNQLLEAGITSIVINLAPFRLGISWSVKLRRLSKVLRGIWNFLQSRPKAGDILYISISGRFGQIYESIFTALARRLGMRIFMHHHSYAYLDRASQLFRLLSSIAGPETTHIALSAGMAMRLRGTYPNCSRVIIISNAVFVGPLVPTAVRSRQSVKTIGFLSNISEEKGVFDFLQVVSRLESDGWNIIAKLAGPFDDSTIEKRVYRYLQSIRSVEYVGSKYDDEKSNFFDEIDVLLFPTRYVNEAEPVTILESMAYGVPVIAFGRGSIGELITMGCGVVVDKDNDFVEATLLQLKMWKASPETFQKASIEARTRFEQLYDQSVSQWTALRAELCDGAVIHTKTGASRTVTR